MKLDDSITTFHDVGNRLQPVVAFDLTREEAKQLSTNPHVISHASELSDALLAALAEFGPTKSKVVHLLIRIAK